MLGLGWFRALALVASAAATVIGAWESFFGNRKLWNLNNATIADIYELKTDIAFRQADLTEPISKDEVEEFYNRYKKITRNAEEALSVARSG